MYLSFLLLFAGKHQNQPAESPGKEAIKSSPKGQRPSTTAKEPHGPPKSSLAYQKPCLTVAKTKQESTQQIHSMVQAHHKDAKGLIHFLKVSKSRLRFFESTRWTLHTRDDPHPRVIKSALMRPPPVYIHISCVCVCMYRYIYIYIYVNMCDPKNQGCKERDAVSQNGTTTLVAVPNIQYSTVPLH